MTFVTLLSLEIFHMDYWSLVFKWLLSQYRYDDLTFLDCPVVSAKSWSM